MGINEQELKRLYNIVEGFQGLLSKEQISTLLVMIEEGVEITTSSLCERIRISPSKAIDVKKHIDSINSRDMAAVMLSLYREIKEEDNTPVVYLTGPYASDGIRLTSPVLSELVLSAEREIIIVSYEIKTNAGQLFDYLKGAAERGIKLIFMIDSLEEKTDFVQWVKRLPNKPELYSRSKDPLDPMSSLHIKCMVVDRKTAMFGSANLTYHGIQGNIEMGLIIKEKKSIERIMLILEELRKDLRKIQ